MAVLTYLSGLALLVLTSRTSLAKRTFAVTGVVAAAGAVGHTAARR
jgi:hypothetical protein